MPVARIITRHASHESEALKALTEQLSAAGYEVEIAPLGAESAAADLVVELDELPVAEAIEAAIGMAREADADVYIAPGLFTHPAKRSHSERSEEPVVEATSAPDVHINVERSGVIGSTLEELGAAMASERREPEPLRHVEIPAPPRAAEISQPAPEPMYADAAPVLRTKLVRPPRRLRSARERQWQRAAFLASIAALAAMLGFALAANVRSSSPLPASVIENQAQQQIPFGPAKMDVSSAARPAKVAPPLSRPGRPALSAVEGARQGGGVPTQATPPRKLQKPSPAKPAPQRRARRVSRGSDMAAEDEVIVRHAPASRAQRSQTTTGVRRYSDEN